jgi:hypothetical protein
MADRGWEEPKDSKLSAIRILSSQSVGTKGELPSIQRESRRAEERWLTARGAVRSADRLSRIGNGIGVLSSEVTRSHCLAQFLGGFSALATRLTNRSLGDCTVDDLALDDLTSLKSIHIKTPRRHVPDLLLLVRHTWKSPAGILRRGCPTDLRAWQ